MTERTIKEMAKELAGVFYEDQERTPGFRKAFPTYKAYIRGQWHQPDGSIKIDKPGWMYHVDLARRILINMLSKPDAVVHPNVKESIYKAILEEHSLGANSKHKVTQRKEMH